MKNEKTNIKVYTTDDYSKFKKLLGNREVTPRRVNKIVSSINAVGYITSPIIVNENMEIIDGQGRYEALKQLGMPIDYIIVKDVGIDACLNMNIYQEKWNIRDYINSYVERGNENYRKVKVLLDTFPLFGLNVVATAITSLGKYNGHDIKNGTLIVSDEDYERGLDNLNYIACLIPYAKKTNGKLEPFFQGVIFARHMNGVDEDRLLERLKDSIGIMTNWSDLATAIQSIEECYNKGLMAKNYVFMYTEYRKLVYSRGGAQTRTSKEVWIDNKLKGK